MSTHPAISVLMPVYNAEKYLAEALESIFAQTFQDFEIIAVDDGSSDSSATILRRYKGPRLQIISHASNLGIVAALNHAIEASRGTFLARMDADDISEPVRFERQFACMLARPNLGILGTFAVDIDESGNMVSPHEPPLGTDEVRKAAFERSSPFIHGSVFIRPEVLAAVGRYSKRFMSEDSELWIRILEKFDGDNLPEPLYRLRLHSPSLSSRTAMRYFAGDELAREYYELRRQGKDPEEAPLLQYFAQRLAAVAEGRISKDLLARFHRKHARWNLDHGMGWKALRHAVSAVRADGFNRDNLYLARKGFTSLFSGQRTHK